MMKNETATMFRFLNQLRASGSINMFGASPVLAEAFGISSKEARVVLAHWMSWASQNPLNCAIYSIKIVINTCFGGFGLSDEAIALFRERKGIADTERTTYADEIARDDYDLVYVVETLGEKANTRYSQLKVVEIPADVEWQIEEYDGSEHIAEQHRVWL